MDTIHGRMRYAEQETERLNAEIAQIARAIHYPECWDTAAFPTLTAALNEMVAWFNCSNANCQRKVRPQSN